MTASFTTGDGSVRGSPSLHPPSLFGARVERFVPWVSGGIGTLLIVNGIGVYAANQVVPSGEALQVYLPAILIAAGLYQLATTGIWFAGRRVVAFWMVVLGWNALPFGAQLVGTASATLAIVTIGYAAGIIASVLLERPRVVSRVGVLAAVLWSVALFARIGGPGDGLAIDSGSAVALSIVPPVFLLAVGRLAAMALRTAQHALTERDRAVRSLVQARDESEAASRAKTRFLASMSHELRTPLNAIIGYSELVLEDPSDPDAVGQDVRRVSAAGRHLLSLVNDVLDMSAIEAGKLDLSLEIVDVGLVLRETLATVEPLVARRDNVLSVSIEDDLPPLCVDDRRLRQVLMNLLSNAAKFTANGQIIVSARSDVSWCCISVQDTGRGIAPEQLRAIFEPFVRDRDSAGRQPGTGLGLAIARDLVTLMGGALSVESTLGVGTTFEIRLPRSEHRLATPSQAATVTPVSKRA